MHSCRIMYVSLSLLSDMLLGIGIASTVKSLRQENLGFEVSPMSMDVSTATISPFFFAAVLHSSPNGGRSLSPDQPLLFTVGDHMSAV